jgi:hypothetical protein
MKKIMLLAVVVMVYAGYGYCEESKAVNRSPFSFVQGFVMGDDYVIYQDKLQKIEDSYNKGEISKDKYLELRSDAEKDYKATKR